MPDETPRPGRPVSSTIFRAIKTGRISAARTEGGNFTIEPIELHRIFPPAETRAEQISRDAVNQDAMPAATADMAQVAQVENEIRLLRDMSALLREQLHETRDTVDDVAGAADRIAQAGGGHPHTEDPRCC